MSERFYVNWPLAPGPVSLEGPEAHHLRVCRARPGDPISLFNGDGSEYRAIVVDVGKRTVTLDVRERCDSDRELNFRLEVAASLPKGERAQFLIEKLTEVGVTSFVPLLCERSMTHPGAGKLDKLERYVIEASKQCGRNRLMAVSQPVPLASYLEPRADEVRLVAHPTGERLWTKCGPEHSSLRIAIGPEGGFSESETSLAVERDWALISLGRRILRVETAAMMLAGIMACAADP